MIWIIGSGNMGREYAKVLLAQKQKFICIGRGKESADAFFLSTGQKAILGGLDAFLKDNPPLPSAVIVSVKIESLVSICLSLLNHGITKILLEKPGFENEKDLKILATEVAKRKATVLIAYNRRFYQSVLKAEEIIREDGGAKALFFEFTEWTHVLKPEFYATRSLNRWVISNSSHVIDTAFFMCGFPKQLHSQHSGKENIEWHPSASIFTGSGTTNKNIDFCYLAAWQCPGRWSIEILTNNFRLYFRPMEELKIQRKGTVSVENFEINSSLDHDFKPGFFLQVEHFLQGDFRRFCSVEEQLEHLDIYFQIANY